MRLRPSMRENYRYLLATVRVAGGHPDPKDIYLAASDSFSALFGEVDSSQVWIAVMESSDHHAIFRYRRGMDTRVEAALAAVSFIGGFRAVIHPLRISGTIITLRAQMKKRKTESARTGGVIIGNSRYSAEIYPSGQIDLKEKGINLQIPLYITEEDIEDLYYDE